MRINSISLVIFYLLIIIGVAAILPSQTNWAPRYGSDHKDPLGTYILYNQLPHIFPQGEIRSANMPVYNTLLNQSRDANYLFVNDVYDADALDVDYLLQFVDEGGQAFIAAERFSHRFKDTIGFNSYHRYYWPKPFDKDSVRTELFLTNDVVSADTAFVHKVLRGSVITDFDSVAVSTIEVLGLDIDENINFFRKKLGLGYIYIHLCPAAFSNYEILHENTASFVSNCLSYLPDRDVIFDDYYKSGKAEKASMLSVLLDKAPMRWAWNIALFSIVLFMIFGARRKSRAIPIMTPYENESMNYIETIGAMHYNHRNNRHIAQKRYQQLKHYLHRRFRIQEADWNELDAELFYERTGVSRDAWRLLFGMVNKISERKEWDVTSLRKFSDEIDNIYSEIKSS